MTMDRRSFITGSMVVLSGSFIRSGAARQAPRSAGPADPLLIEDLVAANRILVQQGLVDGFGHVSARHNKDSNRYLLSRSMAPELVTADDIMEFDLDSNPVDAKGRSTYSERFIHGEIYKVRPDVTAVVHHHCQSLTAFSVSSVPLQPVSHQAYFIGEGVPIFDTYSAAGATDMLISNTTLGRSLARSLGSKPAALMRGHGGVVVGSSLMMAVGRSVYMDVNAKIQVQAMALGGKITYLHPEEVRERAKTDPGFGRAWEAWKRKALGK